jgi:hypothetical protein
MPPGYIQKRKDNFVVLEPSNYDQTPCIYGFAGRMPSSGKLDIDAATALVKVVVPGWSRVEERHFEMKGTSAFGWPYARVMAAFRGELAGERTAVNAMAMALPAGGGQVHVVWGMGSIARCLLDDASFEFLFHGLRPQGWTSDNGAALARALMGSWRYTVFGNSPAGMQQYTFRSGGRYDRDLGSTASVGVSERTSATATGGRFTLRDGELTLTPDNRPGNPDRYYVRVFEELSASGWRHSMTMFDSRANRPGVIQYYRVDP